MSEIPSEIYIKYLKLIQGIKFSKREIDVMACILHGRRSSKIAEFLWISPRTIEVHIRNITEKLDRGGSREVIIDFIEKSDKYSIFKSYYFSLLIQHDFEKRLRDLRKKIAQKSLSCDLLVRPEYAKSSQANQISNCFNILDINLKQETNENINEFTLTWNNPSQTQTFIFQKEVDFYQTFFEFLKEFLPEQDTQEMLLEFCKFRSSINSNQELPSVVKNKKTLAETLVRCDIALPSESLLIQRPNLLSEIEESFTPQIQGIHIVALKGPGGAGKTTLARQYARLQNAQILWEINAENRETLRSSLERLANSLTFSDEDKVLYKEIMLITNLGDKERELLQFIKDRLKLSSDWFLLYDNVEKYSEVRHFLPQDCETWGTGSVLITTRDSNIQINKHISAGIEIGELASEEKATLFSKITNTEERITQDLNEFLDKIPSYPLDVSLAAYFIEATHTPFERYAHYLKTNDNEFIKLQKDLLEEVGDYNKTRYGILTLSLDKIMKENEDFLSLLLLISLLDSQNLSKELLETCKDSAIVDSFIYNLKKYSLISIDPKQTPFYSNFSIHRSTQEIALSYIKKHMSKDEFDLTFNLIIEKLRAYLTTLISKDDIERLPALTLHYEMLLSRDSELFADIRGDLETDLGNIYSGLSYYEEALKLYKEGLKHIDKDKKIGIYLNNCVNQGYSHVLFGDDFSKARTILEHALSKPEINDTENEPILAMGLMALGDFYRWTGEYEKAISTLEKSVNLFKKLDSTNYVGAMMATFYLGAVYYELGHYNKAFVIFNNNIEFSSKHINNYSIRRMFSYEYIANIYRKFGFIDKAIDLYLEYNNTMDISEQQEHKRFSYFSASKALYEVQLADCYIDTQHYKEAQLILESALELQNNLFMESHIVFHMVYISFGKLNVMLHNYERAEQFINKGISVITDNFGKNHFKVAEPLTLLGQMYCLQNKLDEAEETYLKCLSIYEQAKHPDKYIVLENLCDLYLKKANTANDIKESTSLTQQAMNCLNEALELLNAHFPKDSPYLKRVREKIKMLRV